VIIRYRWVSIESRRHARLSFRFTADGSFEPLWEMPESLVGCVVKIEVVADQGVEVPVRHLRDMAIQRGAIHVAPIATTFAKGELPKQDLAPLPTEPLELLEAYARTNPPPAGVDLKTLFEEVRK